MAIQAQEVFKNLFHGALDGDMSASNLAPTTYYDSANVTLVGDGRYTVLQNVKGTTKISDIVPVSSTDVLGIFETKYTIGTTTGVNCLTIITATQGGNLKIFCHDLDNNVVYSLYQEAVGADYFTDDRIGDAIDYSERGFDTLYFTDNYHEVRKIRCVIPTGYTPWFMTKEELGCLKHNPIGTITLSDIVTGGSLLTGSYQLAYQLIHPTKNKYTGWSLLTNPIHVYTSVNGEARAGVGLPSNKKIKVIITPTSTELNTYTHFRLAVVENINPEGVVNLEVGMTKIESITAPSSGSYSSGVITDYEIKDNSQLDSTTLDDITIDLAAITKAKTLAIGNSRLILGNLTYADLTYDNGSPVTPTGSILRQTGSSADSFSSDVFSSQYKGHFRDEVYRYCIAYFDEYGRFSPPKTLNMSSITDNQISGGFIDMKFPRRNNASGNYTPLDSSNKVQSLGLRLVGLNNHPTWAKGFVILRAKRKKNILFQSPVIMMSTIHGIGAIGKYPAVGVNITGNAINYTTPEPMGPSSTMMPMNLFYGVPMTSSTWSSSGGTGTVAKIAGEMYLTRNNGSDVVMVFPDANMYSNYNTFAFTNSEQVDVIDAATFRMYTSNFNTTGYGPGNYADTDVSGSFFATRYRDYYHYFGRGLGTEILAVTPTVTNNAPFDNYTTGTTFAGQFIFDYDKLVTKGVNMGYAPITQRCTVLKLDQKFTDLNTVIPMYYGASATVSLAAEVPIFSDFIQGSGTGLYGSLVNTLPIANFISSLTDGRYGGVDDYNELIFTGTKVVFTDAELPTVEAGGSLPKTVDVWGGDCIVSAHTFKVADTAYGCTNQTKMYPGSPAGLTPPSVAERWGAGFDVDVTASPNWSGVGMPVAYKSASQYITVILESEYHGSVRDNDTADTVGTYDGFVIKGALSSSVSRTPLTYQSNLNLAKQNDQKIFAPIDPTQVFTDTFPARVAYSNVKVYESNIEGFDAFPALNYYDLPEIRGPIYKIIITNEALYSLQETGIAYVPVGERIVELSNTSQLGVRTGDVFGKYIYITTRGGVQHNRSVVNTGQALFAFDNLNKSVYKIQGSALEDITPGILSKGRSTYFVSPIPEKQIFGSYDQIRNEYWLSNNDGSFCLIYNEDYKKWISNYTFSSGFAGGRSTNDKFYVVGNNAGNYATETMFTGNPTQFFGNYATDTFVSFVINPMVDTGKTFDDILVASNEKFLSIDIVTERDASLGNQTVSGITLDVTSRGEGNYRAKTLRDVNNARLRGLYAKATLHWKVGAGNPLVSLYSVSTKFRPSANLF